MWQSIDIVRQAYRKIQDMKGEEANIYHADVPE
jgi:NADH-quinone oxidoreductase subunit D